MQITVLSGGVGGARFVRGLVHALSRDGVEGDHRVTVVGNTGDDITLFGLRVCPDLDSLLYTLGGAVDEGQGWGREEDSRRVMDELGALGVQPQWFGLGDKDLGTHVARSLWLSQGATLSEVTARLAARWGLPGQGVRLLPATDTPIETHVVVDDGDGGERAIHFQEWWVRHGAGLPARRFTVAGLHQATPAPGVLEAVREADVVLLPPSNPVVSIGIILGVPGVRDALRGTRAPVVGVSPIIGGRPVRGHADACLAPLGVEVSAAGVAGLYADLLDGWLVDDADAGSASPARVTVRHLDLLMRDTEGAARIAGAALDLARDLSADAR
ncbi:2-phospho-L-lactate transferase [Ornithinimicrobium pekingense]|uniref:2-phospho-L-lactate transferase n=1 Tax=Ornithinimicrobium pekingense TaxID=384677 RepID=A0ABQ2F713_9MICO|nr:2-phospho-L-lactate transferase [Ornithinimicrobium pekingense]GGK67072.1 2-phospho-L-lactate transferase [Ornithinimicrobium pekingense]